ncbi:hypothetical protein OC846_002159 [Tilletia horrida]|uniref:Uncharacterized protein n=1 Tax=Tilletia horrida TaxID=155126 RepID=A0AAN6GSK2_9BASI|nr:hypothetical protein OC846_002159 [Tilletia horrida]
MKVLNLSLPALLLSSLSACLAQQNTSATTTNPLDLDPAVNETADLSFAIESGNYLNYIHRTSLGSHTLLLTTPDAAQNGTENRFLYATPADNSGAFSIFQNGVNDTDPAPLSIYLYNDTVRTALGPGGLVGVTGDLLLSKNASMTLSIVGSVRAMRDYVEGNGTMHPIFNYTVTQLDSSVVWFSRRWLNQSTVVVNGTSQQVQLGMELRYEALNGTTFEVAPGVADVNGTLSQPTVRIVAPQGQNATVAFTVATNATQFGLLPSEEVFRSAASNDSDNAAREQMRFLTQSEKFMAGSWRFLTYFGRDTLFTLKLLTGNRVLSPVAVETVLGAALGRVNLTDGRVTHEETLGDYATFVNLGNGHPELGNDVFLDYKMQDTNFLLLPQLATYLLDYNGTSTTGSTNMTDDPMQGQGSGPGPFNATLSNSTDGSGSGNGIGDGMFNTTMTNSTTSNITEFALNFLNRTSSIQNGTTFMALLEANINYVLNLTAPFVQNATWDNLIANEVGIPVGNWRDSNAGLGGGTRAYDVNAAHIPAALYAIADLADAGIVLNATLANSTRAAAQFWEAEAPKFFYVSVNGTDASSRLTSFINATQLDQSLLYGKGSLNGTDGDNVTLSSGSDGTNRTFFGLSLYEDGTPVEVLHSDLGFALVFQRNISNETINAAADLLAPFPLGLATNVGLVCANPAIDSNTTHVESLSRSAYHGTVIWAFNAAMYALGFARVKAVCDGTADSLLQARMVRADWCDDDALMAKIDAAETMLWNGVNGAASEKYTEVHSWSWANDTGKFNVTPLSAFPGATEADAIQLWSFGFLGLTDPTMNATQSGNMTAPMNVTGSA